MVASKKNIKCTIDPADILTAVIWAPNTPALPAVDLDKFARLIEKKRKERAKGIALVLSEAQKKGKECEPLVAAVMYDTEMAPHTNNEKQLGELGILVPKISFLDAATAEEIRSLNWDIINGMALLGVFFSGTDHLNEKEFCRILIGRILQEEVRDIPPSNDVSEFIDLSPCAPAEGCPEHNAGRDHLLPRPNREKFKQDLMVPVSAC